MKLFVYLHDTEDKISGIYEMPYEERYLDNLWYMFSQGNYGCDCNRSIFLGFGSHGKYDRDLTCNTGKNRIVIDQILDEAGKLLYRDEV